MNQIRYLAVLSLLAAALFLGLAGYMHRAQTRALADAAAAPLPAPEAPRPPAPPPRVPDLARTLRALKLVTVEIDTAVAVRSDSESWRGDVSASVHAPVRLFYGVDLAGLGDGAVRSDLLSGGVTVRLPAPRRLATEVFGSAERHDVTVGWGRFRDVAGEYHLGLARVRLYEQARAIELSPEQRAGIERTTSEQVTGLVRAILGEPVPVSVVFEPAGTSADLATAPDGPDGTAP